MKVKVEYEEGGPAGRLYTFEAPDETQIGDTLMDGEKKVTVLVIGSGYNGPTRSLLPPGAKP